MRRMIPAAAGLFPCRAGSLAPWRDSDEQDAELLALRSRHGERIPSAFRGPHPRALRRPRTLLGASRRPDARVSVVAAAAANALVLSWMHDAGMQRPARRGRQRRRPLRGRAARPALPDAGVAPRHGSRRGRYDGMLGVVSAIECVASLAARRLQPAIRGGSHRLRRRRRRAFQRACCGQPCGGRHVRPGQPRAQRCQRQAHARRAARVRPRSGRDRRRAARRRAELLAYVELHIEQGPVLESEGLPVGVVTRDQRRQPLGGADCRQRRSCRHGADAPAPRRARRGRGMRARRRVDRRQRSRAWWARWARSRRCPGQPT